MIWDILILGAMAEKFKLLIWTDWQKREFGLLIFIIQVAAAPQEHLY